MVLFGFLDLLDFYLEKNQDQSITSNAFEKDSTRRKSALRDIYSTQMSIHDVQSSRYQARQRRHAGRHQAEINKLGSKWSRVQAIKHAVTLSRPGSDGKKEPVIDSVFAENYRRDVRNFMQKFHGRKNTNEARTSIELTRVLLQQDGKNRIMGQLLNGLYDLESDEDDVENEECSPVTSKSSIDSEEYNLRQQFTQSAFTRKSSGTRSSIKRSKSFLGSQLSENQSDYFQKIKTAEKDFYFDEPKQPPILFFTDGRGNFITGKEQQFIRARTIEKDRLLKTYNGHFQECQDFLERAKKRRGNLFSNTWLSAGDQIKRAD
ncbi:unnamed protein product [Oikopleura dioica]|uniref:Uncharacterized protein n=1 Tax=Oikopleura dioica TaxID=34765 RepID=E4XRD9_OIKDI|nr:unnamed protein product [Oikopleura dioica]